MKRIISGLLLSLLVLATVFAFAQAASQSLPPALSQLIPAGAKASPTYAKSAMFAVADFTAEKKLSAGHSAYYNFHLLCSDTNSPLWKMRGPIYQAENEKKIDQKRQSLKAGANPPVTYDPAKETKYPWGTGFTQRVVHHYMGAGSGPDYIDYRTAYIGLIGGNIFELEADGVPTADEADQWANSVAAVSTKLSMANIGS